MTAGRKHGHTGGSKEAIKNVGIVRRLSIGRRVLIHRFRGAFFLAAFSVPAYDGATSRTVRSQLRGCLMSSLIACDEDLIRRLPLPLAQLYRRAHNAKTPLERHLTAFYLWEASLKLLGAVALVEYAAQPTDDPHLAE